MLKNLKHYEITTCFLLYLNYADPDAFMWSKRRTCRS